MELQEGGDDKMPPKFQLGKLVATRGADEALKANKQLPTEFIVRHVSGDWGDLEPEDKVENELSLLKGFRILSAYHLKDGTKIYVITEADRSMTTVLLPSEY
jgi:hypothetical protein